MSEPITIDQQILDAVRSSLASGISKALESYNNPITKLAEAVVLSRQGEIQSVFTAAMDSALAGEFREALQSACAHKIAKVLVSKMEGEIEKKANDLRSNPEIRAKITLAISEVINSLGK
jgi:hypothetical protein